MFNLAIGLVLSFSFLLFATKTGRRNYFWESLTTNLLSNWHSSEVNLYVHVYGQSMSTQAVFKAAKKQFIDPTERDRAGAAAISVIQDYEAQLKKSIRTFSLGVLLLGRSAEIISLPLTLTYKKFYFMSLRRHICCTYFSAQKRMLK